MLRLMRLQIPDTATLLAPGTADDLVQQLECAFGSARVPVCQPEIGVDHAGQLELREMVALRNKLGPDDNVELSLRDCVELLAQALDRFDEIARQHQDAALRTQFGRFLLQPLDAGADRNEAVGGLAVRALRRRRHRETAVMAHQPAPETMIDQPRVAIGAGEPKAAAAAERQRRITAAIEEQQRLFAAFERMAHDLRQTRRDEAAARRAFRTQVNRLDRRKITAAETLRQMHAPV